MELVSAFGAGILLLVGLVVAAFTWKITTDLVKIWWSTRERRPRRNQG